MDRGLVTRGVNVRPHKRSSESQTPHGLVISGVYDPTGKPGRPLRGYRPEDYGLRTRRVKRSRTARHVRVTKPNARSTEQVFAEWQSAVADVQACKAQGIPYQSAAQRARALKAEHDRMQGLVFAANADVDQGSSSWQVDNIAA